MKGKIYLGVFVSLFASILLAATAFAGQKITLYGNAISPGIFMADDHRIYHISNKDTGKAILMESSILESKIKVNGSVERSNGRWLLKVDNFKRINIGCGPISSCGGILSDTPVYRN